MLYILYKIAKFLAQTLPQKIAYKISDGISNFYYLLAKKDKKIALANMQVVLNQAGGQQQIHQASRAVFVNFGRYLVEFFRSSQIDLKYIEKYVQLDGKGNLDTALSLKKGVLVVSAHLGNWEWGAVVLSLLGYPVNVVAWTHKNKLVNQFFLDQRQSKGVSVISLGTGIRNVFSALKNNEIVGLLGDIDYTNPTQGIKVEFFGHQTIMPQGPAVFSLKTGAPIVPAFLLREKNSKFRYVFSAPLIYNACGDEQQDLVGLTQDLTKVIEHYIALYPRQWFMLTPRW